MNEPRTPDKKGRYWRECFKFSDGTTCRLIYQKGVASPEPTFELWRDADNNVIEHPNPELYREELEMWERVNARSLRRFAPSEEKQRETQKRLEERLRSPEYKENLRRRAELRGLSVEEYQQYRVALKKYAEVELWKPGPAPHKPQPEDFRGTLP